MFSKLALRNVRRSFRDYGVYLLTLTFGVCLFYTFNSIDGQGVMVYLAQSQNPMAQLIQTILDIFSVFVAVVLACLILYANTFLIRRRKRELGTYLLLGLSQRQVSGLLVLETLVRLNREKGMTVVMVSSELMELRSICDRIAIVAEGKVVDVLETNASDADFGLAMSGIKPEHVKQKGGEANV